MSPPLAPCDACRRHVRVTESACPFCGAALAPTLAERVVPGTSQRLSRAALVAFATTLTAAAAPGCDRTPAGPAAVYGGPPPPIVAPRADAAATPPTPSPQTPPAAVYGGPPPPMVPPSSGDASAPPAPQTADAGAPPPPPTADNRPTPSNDEPGAVVALYGAPARPRDQGSPGVRYGGPARR